jgi:hypothetical protein
LLYAKRGTVEGPVTHNSFEAGETQVQDFLVTKYLNEIDIWTPARLKKEFKNLEFD